MTNTKTVLLIEDDQMIHRIFAICLKDTEFHLEFASNGREGLEMLKKVNPDLIITDIVMPEIDGIEVLFNLHEDHPHIKVIAMSAGGQIDAGEYLETAKVLGVSHTMHKPLDINDILPTIRAVIAEEEVPPPSQSGSSPN